jgi:hypothetical protein
MLSLRKNTFPHTENSVEIEHKGTESTPNLYLYFHHIFLILLATQ